ncbi:hypothetical protein NXH76_22295 [Blautia schinkii]|nr:hypothetical protein [Blautia schinkii]
MPNVDYIFLGLITLCGVIMLITNKPLFVSAGKYTEESLKKYSRPAGITTILMGAFGLAFLYTLRLFFNEKISGWITLACLAAVIISIISNIVIIKKTLVKK